MMRTIGRSRLPVGVRLHPRLLRDVGRVMAIDAIAVLPGSHGIRSLGLPME